MTYSSRWRRALAAAGGLVLLIGACAPRRSGEGAPAPVARGTTDAAASQDVLAVLQRLFDAMAARDTATARAILLPGAQFRALRTDTTLAAPRVQSDTAFLRQLATRPDRLLERIWAPVVHVDGPLATVWAPYDFHIDGKWSHCGVDAVTLARTAAGWRVAGFAYTVQRQGCAPSPLGAPR